MYKINHVIFAFMVLGFLYAQTAGVAMAASCIKMQGMGIVEASAGSQEKVPCHDMMMADPSQENSDKESPRNDCPMCMSVCLQSTLGLTQGLVISDADLQAAYDADVRVIWYSIAYERVPPPPKVLL